MKTAKEIRNELTYLIDTYFTNSTSNFNSFFDWFNCVDYYQDIKNADKYSFYDEIDYNRFEDDVYES